MLCTLLDALRDFSLSDFIAFQNRVVLASKVTRFRNSNYVVGIPLLSSCLGSHSSGGPTGFLQTWHPQLLAPIIRAQ